MIIHLCKLLGKLMSVSRRVGGKYLELIVTIIKAIHNGLMITGLYPYIIGASVVYYARYEIIEAVRVTAINGAFYILKSTIAQQGLKWLTEIIRQEATKVAQQIATETATAMSTQVATQVATDLIADRVADETRGRLTTAITGQIFTILANPQNINMIAGGVQGLIEAAPAVVGIGGGKKKRTKKRKRRRRGGSKKTKRRGKKSKKGGKRRHGGSKKRNRRSQRKTKK